MAEGRRMTVEGDLKNPPQVHLAGMGRIGALAGLHVVPVTGPHQSPVSAPHACPSTT